eukprot:s3057_g12.t1
MPDKPQNESWCITCTYPPCEGCGRPRPKQTKYQVQVLSQWWCAACSHKRCVDCDTPLGPRARGDARCAACRFPPCDGGCGKPQPAKGTYAVTILPRWTCDTCRTKTASNLALPCSSSETRATAPPQGPQMHKPIQAGVAAVPTKRRLAARSRQTQRPQLPHIQPCSLAWAGAVPNPVPPMIRGETVDWSPKPSLYSTLLLHLVMDACESQRKELPAAERQRGLEAVCVHVNEAARAEGQAARLLLSASTERPWKLDLQPGNIERQYGGRRHRPTRAQAASGKATGRLRRVLQRTR